MAGAVNGGAEVGDAAGDAGAGLVVDDHDGPDGVGDVGAEASFDLGRVGAVPPVAGEELDVEAEAGGHGAPEGGELAGFRHQDLVAGGEGVDDRSFPGAGAAGGEDDDVVGAEDGAEAFENALAEASELGAAVVDGGAVDGAKDSVGDVAGPGDLQEVPSTAVRHRSLRLVLHSDMTATHEEISASVRRVAFTSGCSIVVR